MDDDPTHFIDLTVSKDRKFFVISSNTKEDSEVYVLPRGSDSDWPEMTTPFKLVPRQPNH